MIGYNWNQKSRLQGGFLNSTRDGPLEMENVTSEQHIMPVAQRLHY